MQSDNGHQAYVHAVIINGATMKLSLRKSWWWLTLLAIVLMVVSIQFQPATAIGADSEPSDAEKSERNASAATETSDPTSHADPQLQLGTNRMIHPEGALCVLYSPNGRSIASGGWDGVVHLWDAKQGRLVRRFVCSDESLAVHGLSFSGDGSTIAAACGLGNVYIFSTATGRTIAHLTHPTPGEEYVHSVSLSPDGKTIASHGGGNQGGTVRVWDVATGKQMFEHRFADRRIYDTAAVSFSHDGLRLAAVRGAQLAILDCKNSKVIAKLTHQGQFTFTSVVFSRDDKSVITGGHGYIGDSERPELSIYDAWDCRKLRQLKSPALAGQYEGSVSVSRDSKIMASGHLEKVLLWDLDKGDVLREVATTGYPGLRCQGTAVSPDGTSFCAICDNWDRIHIWKTSDDRPLFEAGEGHAGYVKALTWFADGRRVASGGNDATIRLWDALTGRQTAKFQAGKHPVSTVLLTPDNDTLIADGARTDVPLDHPQRGCCRFFDVRSGRLLGEVHTGSPLTAIAITADGKTLATAAGGWRHPFEQESTPIIITLWDVPTRKLKTELKGHARNVVSLKFSRDNKTLISVGKEGKVLRWDLLQAKLLDSTNVSVPVSVATERKPGNQPLRISSVDFSEDLRTLFIFSEWSPFLWIRKLASDEGAIRIDKVHPIVSLQSVDVSPNGQIFALSAHDGDRMNSHVRLYDFKSGRQLYEFRGEENGLSTVRFSPDGKRIAVATRLGPVLVYEVPATIMQHGTP